jgi:hypothetical protein
VILEAFSQYLQSADQKTPATGVLARWLWEKLSSPPQDNVDRVLHCEIKVAPAKEAHGASTIVVEMPPELKAERKPSYVFRGTSSSGSKLLKVLYEYCLSYEQQKWARFVHSLKASDFKYCK